MPRRDPAPGCPLIADSVYNFPLVTQLANRVLLDGKKFIAQKIVYGALEDVARGTEQDPIQTLKRAMENIRPHLEVRSRRVGGVTY